MKNIAIITARGGSKRIPKKNIKVFCGKPIIEYSIESAIRSSLFDIVMVSTDCEEIADIAKKSGATVPFLRSEYTSGDNSTTEEVLIEVLERYEKDGLFFDNVCCIYPTAPFVNAEKLRLAYQLLDGNEHANSVVPVVKFSYPPQRGMVIHNGFVYYQFPENATIRSQDLESIYHDCGQFYFCRVKALLKYRDLICPNCLSLVFSEEEVQDIDNYSDWKLAEMKYRLFSRSVEE